MDYIDASVAEALEASGGSHDRVTLVAHSAAGWLSRVWMAELGGNARVAKLVSLGSPHRPVPEGIPGVVDQTRGILKHVEETMPGAFHAPEVEYVCIAGTFARGARWDDESAKMGRKLLGQSYKMVHGESDVVGDGITPVPTAHLPGALNIELKGVYHSPLGASDARPWYGTDSILDQWIVHL